METEDNIFLLGQSHCKTQADLKLTMQSRLASNSQSSCLSLPSAGMTDMHHHAKFENLFLNI
jgi:hypothetical protein